MNSKIASKSVYFDQAANKIVVQVVLKLNTWVSKK